MKFGTWIHRPSGATEAIDNNLPLMRFLLVSLRVSNRGETENAGTRPENVETRNPCATAPAR